MKRATPYLKKQLPTGRFRLGPVCSRLSMVLCILAGLAACSREDGSEIMPNEACEIGLYGSVATRAVEAESPAGYTPMTDNPYYGTVHVRHTRNGKLNIEGYADADKQQSFEANAGLLQPVKDVPAKPESDYRWYWENSNTPHVFHAWTLPTDGKKQGEGEAIARIDDGQYADRFGMVDLSMEKQYEFETPEQFEDKDGNKIDINGRLSNLEYFIGAVKGPVNMADNGSTNVTLEFKHLVAKIIVAEIKHRKSDGALQDVDESVSFNMPNMPNKAYWTTGVPADDGNYDLSKVASVAPHLLALTQIEEAEVVDFKDYSYQMQASYYGVSGTLEKGWCFYIYPCKFDATNTQTHKMGEIEFQLGTTWYYGTLESLTGVKELQAGDCIALTLLLMDGEIRGLYPHIVDWSTDEKEVEHHDHPGIYNEDDWKKYIDWIKEYDQSGDPKPEPPAGLLDGDGNLNLYCDLDLRTQPSQYSTPDKLLFPEGGGKLVGNGHRVKTTSDWSKLKDNLTDIYVSANGEYTEYE